MPNTVLGKVSVTPRGTWQADVTYHFLDVVNHAGNSYIVKKECTGVTPEEGDTYMLAASKGDPGKQGVPGPRGPKGVDGVAVAADGVWAFNVNEEGHLLLSYAGDTPPDAYIGEDGHLYINV